MMAYYYDASIYCEDCAPKGAESWPEQETDCPENCSVCHCPLDYTLTSDGVAYVLEAIRESLRAGREQRNTVHKCYDGTYYKGSPHKAIVRDWAGQLKWYCGLDEKDERLIEKYLSWIETY